MECINSAQNWNPKVTDSYDIAANRPNNDSKRRLHAYLYKWFDCCAVAMCT